MSDTTTQETAPDVLSINARMFAVISAFKAKYDIRYYLNCVSVRPHPNLPGVLIEATNGHQLALAYDARGTASRPFMLRVAPGLVSACLRARSTILSIKGGRLVVHEAPKGFALDSPQAQALQLESYILPGKPEILEGGNEKFPDVSKILPRNPADLKPFTMPPMNSGYIATICEAAARVNPGPSRSRLQALAHYTLGEDAQNSALYTRLVECEQADNYLFVTMPMRLDRYGHASMPQFANFGTKE